MNVDLHSHSSASDGALLPAVLVQRAVARGVDTLALTDHDDVSGFEEAAAAAREAGLRLIPGVEISTQWGDPDWRGEKTGIHLLGLGIDPSAADLQQGLAGIRLSRAGRAERIAESLAKAGIPDALEGAAAYAGNPSLISRAHFARYLAAQGHARDVKHVFDRYLVPGRPGYVAHTWPELDAAVKWIQAAGGAAVLAHPGRYGLPRRDMRILLAQFRDAGGAGVEVVSGSHTPEQWREYAALAAEFGLAGSRGSDFHAPGESKTDLGALPELPAGVTPVWRRWE